MDIGGIIGIEMSRVEDDTDGAALSRLICVSVDLYCSGMGEEGIVGNHVRVLPQAHR